MDKPQCRVCVYFEKIDEQHGDEEPGVCIRYPPRAVSNDDGIGFPGQYRMVYPGWSCGEHPDFLAYMMSLKPASGAEG